MNTVGINIILKEIKARTLIKYNIYFYKNKFRRLLVLTKNYLKLYFRVFCFIFLI